MAEPTTKKQSAFPTDITFLHIEDMPNLREQMASDLRSLGVTGRILEGPSCREALIVCEKEHPDFIICDWNLPDGTGLQILKKLRSTLKYKKTPIVMCTTMDDIQNLLAAVSSGANDYIVKPWTKEELQKKIQLTWSLFIYR
jgi:two-component system chemotaxis response regulator CheY